MRTARLEKARPKRRVTKALDPMKTPVASIMTKRVQSVRPDTSLEAAMDVLMTKDISHLPVVEDGTLVGVLSKTDLVRERFMEGEREQAPLTISVRRGVRYDMGAGFHEDDASGRHVSDVMSTKVRTVKDSSTIAEAAIAMSRYRVHGLPVVNAAGGLVGFVSTLDVVRWVAQPQE
jgi:CBS domain-containing protein